MRLIDAIGLKQALAVSAILEDKKTVEQIIDEQPTIEPEREKGEWVYNSPVTMKCNRCGLVIKDWDWHRFKICPNCGADMRGNKHEIN